MKAAAIIVAAGRGERAGRQVPKQLVRLAGRPLLMWSLETFTRHPDIMAVVLVAPAGEDAVYAGQFPAASRCVAGAETRSGSVRAGLRALSDLADITHVLIHDAARPGVDHDTIDRLLEALKAADGVAPALPVVDALKRETDGSLQNVVREGLWRVQTPQGFDIEVIRRALENAPEDVVDDLAAVERLGARLKLVEGSARLAKITFPEDFDRMSRLLAPPALPRVGTGFDVHAFGPGEAVTLCGVTIPYARTLKGHSDADVAWHALTDAILGALALGDIGDHFPPSDPQWRGAPSSLFLKRAGELAAEHAHRISQCDITLICEAPKIKPHRAAMRARTAEVLGIDATSVSIKATTTEGLGFAGRGEGIAAQAIAVLAPLP